MRGLLPAALVGAAFLLAAGQVGYMCARSELGELRAELAVAERSREQLTAEVSALEQSLTSARGRAQTEAADAEAADDAASADLERLEGTVARLEREKKQAERSRRDLTRTRERLEAELATLRVRAEEAEAAARQARVAPARVIEPDPAPAAVDGGPAPAAVDGGPPAALRGSPQRPADSPGACPELSEPSFAIRQLAVAERRLGGALALRVERDSAGLVLTLGPVGERYRLSDAPERFSFDCRGEPYVVSVCSIRHDPLAVEGRITRADAWRDACGSAR